MPTKLIECNVHKMLIFSLMNIIKFLSRLNTKEIVCWIHLYLVIFNNYPFEGLWDANIIIRLGVHFRFMHNKMEEIQSPKSNFNMMFDFHLEGLMRTIIVTIT
jgi:hypothetical protein